ncbi:MmcQ/YjbR family DNA-binding protein [Paenibacillus spongiae]|uniref:MmcQ/YjbR family DNA-binding protein n=1 Tax=Paenibacillus spongiae TaxID=2909671 RepID=A0ABY5SB18_9BACL|nr:MmcQ/YjbR family DNA-binding protein [Paenibacillus spongiae]UVI31134.1 MmcQ/YjbR family DNA-binding protein [Paenibacillus spongiae]
MIATTIDPYIILIAGPLAIIILLSLHFRWRARVRSVRYWLEEAEHRLEEAENLLPDIEGMATIAAAAYCLSKQGVHKDYRFGNEPLTVHVGGKIFAFIGSSSLLLKCDSGLAKQLRQRYDAVTPGYHLDSTHWNTVRCDGSIPEEELRGMIDHAYELACRERPKEQRDRKCE